MILSICTKQAMGIMICIFIITLLIAGELHNHSDCQHLCKYYNDSKKILYFNQMLKHTVHVKFWKCIHIRKSEGLGENGILYVRAILT